MRNFINWPVLGNKVPAPQAKGHVALVGAGPGDPDLITVRALRALRQAEVVIYDALVSPALLEEVRPGPRIIFAGKRAGTHSMSQETINSLLVKFGQAGKQVVRLKGGDPFVFGRGGEEAEALKAAGVDFEIVPGISSAIAVPAYAGIPLTHRNYASNFTVLTGHEKAGATTEATSGSGELIAWDALVKLGGTLVFLMGVGQLPKIRASLIEAGLAEDIPAALIEWGTTARQRTVTGPLSNIVEIAREANIGTPAATVIAKVVALREQLDWFVPAVLGQPEDLALAEQRLEQQLVEAQF